MRINNTDAQTLGIRMGEGFLSAIAAPAPLKDFIENESRLEDGKRVLVNNPKLSSREVTLPFVVMGYNEADFLAKLRALEQILYAGLVIIYLPVMNQTYRLTYQRSQTYAQNTRRTACKISIKFSEANPANRGND